METNSTYKFIANRIRANIFAEKNLRDKHSAEEKRLWDEAFKIGPTDRAAAEELLKKAQGEEMEARIHSDNMRHLRTALWNMLDILGVAYDSFHPELAEF